MKLYTIGFTQKPARRFFSLLKDAGIERLIDIRLNPGGQLAGFAKQNDLAFFLSEIVGCEYRHIVELAPTAPILSDYRDSHDWEQYVRRLEALMDERKVPDSLDPMLFTEGARSLGTIRPREITSILYQGGLPDKRRYRIAFTDAEGKSYRLAVTDLAFRYFLDDLASIKKLLPQKAAAQITTLLNDAHVFLRIGLTRGWEKHPDRCYLQITGVHTVPDYLEGRCYADFPQAHHPDLSEDEPLPF